MTGFNQDGYVPVAQRIAAFYEKYPDGSLQSEILSLTDHQVLVKATAYRTPTDDKPGIGHAAGVIPGTTPFTKGSEVENAETSAWGRAIAALGFEVKEGVATAEDVRNARQPAQEAPQRPAPRPVASRPVQTAPAPSRGVPPLTVREAMDALVDVDRKAVSAAGKELFGTWSLKEMTAEQRGQLVAHLIGGGAEVPSAPPPSQPVAGDDLWEGMPAA